MHSDRPERDSKTTLLPSRRHARARVLTRGLLRALLPLILLLSACNSTVESTSARARSAPRTPAPASPAPDSEPRATVPPAEAPTQTTPRGSGLATGRGLMSVELPPLEFLSDLGPIQGRVELCLTPELRTRQWNVAAHPFRIDLGSRAALNVERLTKSAFRDVSVVLDRNCPSGAGFPALDIRIRSANRDPYRNVRSGMQNTSVVLETTFFDGTGAPIWTRQNDGESSAPRARRIALSPAGTTSRRHHHAAREFGHALDQALRRLHDSILRSKQIRDAYSTSSASSGADSIAKQEAKPLDSAD